MHIRIAHWMLNLTVVAAAATVTAAAYTIDLLNEYVLFDVVVVFFLFIFPYFFWMTTFLLFVVLNPITSFFVAR